MDLHDAYSALGLKRSGDTLVSTKVCSRCQRRVAEYRFTACDGFAIATYHCMEHGDVIPARDHPPPHYSCNPIPSRRERS